MQGSHHYICCGNAILLASVPGSLHYACAIFTYDLCARVGGGGERLGTRLPFCHVSETSQALSPVLFDNPYNYFSFQLTDF